ncbi:YhcN/YlaJ family sporulation lipoprotein [Halobacillus shinanisalinarum]|uniref:YhcN/YlaJ family sporulation lipoprotein n=1 Tax=Halobacillus shinanisalinarum TaxID=2932258 RepID=A0ABY4H119_9BACI|nr:YhcN/YlaJ family sporulation lipoprotein [Halobacillus shinanisalinarum]UOQ93855.1 YhcN/YlaJ family sporulation lipoprotein [Halobacillus shinanisalinarum]
MWKMITMFLLICIFLIACQAEEPAETGEGNYLYEPVEYGGNEAQDHDGRIPTGEDSYFKRRTDEEMRNTKYNESNRSHDNDFNNEDAMEITHAVNEFDEVTQTQTFTNGERVYVAVMINPYDRRNGKVVNKIRQKVETMTDLEVVVYSNNSQWEDVKDMNARLKATQAPENIKEKVTNFFKQDR